jgi:hypothetical protein
MYRSRTPTPSAQNPRRDVRSANNNPKPKQVPDNKQKQHDNKRVNNQPNNGVR